MTSPGPKPSTIAEHFAGSSEGWHGKITPEGPFKPEKDRYRLFIGTYILNPHTPSLSWNLE